MTYCEKPAEPNFVREGGIMVPIDTRRDPFEALDDLMAVVEVLCPVWPQREAFTSGSQFLL